VVGIRTTAGRRLGILVCLAVASVIVADWVAAPTARAAFHRNRVLVAGALVSMPAMAAQASGASLVAWSQLDGSSGRIAAQRIGANGVPEASPVWVSAPGGTSDGVAVALSPAGDGVIAWLQEVDGVRQMRMRRWSAAGELGPIVVESSPSVIATSVAVAIAIDGTVIAIWDQATRANRFTTWDGVVRAVRWPAGGQPERALRLNDHTHQVGHKAPDTMARPAIGMDARGDAVLFWPQPNPDPDTGRPLEAHGMRWAIGQASGRPRLLYRGPESGFVDVVDVGLAVAANGDAVLLYTRGGNYGEFGNPDMVVQRWTAAGDVESVRLAGDQYVGGEQPHAAMNAVGDAVLTWYGYGFRGLGGKTLRGAQWPASGALSANRALSSRPDGTHEIVASQLSMRSGKAELAWIVAGSHGAPYAVQARAWPLESGAKPSAVTTLASSATGAAMFLASSSSADRTHVVWTTGPSPTAQDHLIANIEFPGS